MTDLSVIGHPDNHDWHGVQIVTGRADYAGDRLPGTKLYGALALSAIAHGVIENIDVSRALSEAGVRAVITHRECAIWSREIRQWGQEVAGVVADDPAAAVRAARLIKVTYQQKPAVFDPDKALDKNSPLSGVAPGTNSQEVSSLERGDLRAGLAAAEVIVDTAQPWSATYQHHTLEPHQAVAWWLGDDVYVWTPSQHIHSARSYVASALGLPLVQVHAFTHFTGCALGDKNTANAAIVAVVMSRAVDGAPVYFQESRRDNALVNTRQFAMRSTIRLGAKRDGTLTAIDAHFLGDGGCNPVAPVGDAPHGLRTTYSCPAARFKVDIVNTNTPQRAFWRCVADPPGAFNYDIALDKLAYELKMNPYELRRKNLRAADAPDQDPPFLVWSGNGTALCFDRVYEESGYAGKWHQPGQDNKLPDGRLHGIALTGHLDAHGTVANNVRGAMVTLTPDGKCLINVGGARASDGSLVVCAHIAAETLGIKYEDVSCGDWGNTDISLNAGMQAGSTFTPSAGAAFVVAAEDARAKLFAVAVRCEPFLSVGASVGDLDAKDGIVFLKNDHEYHLSFRELMGMSAPIAGTGAGWGPTLRTRPVGDASLGSPCNSSGSAAACAEVAVDIETGEVEVMGLWNTVDSGRTIFKQGTLKQLSSGCEQMIGQALFYGDIYDEESGALLNTGYTEALFPTTLDIDPERLHVADVESDDAAGPYGAHGIAEPCVSNYSAIVCAIFNATGKWVDPEKGGCTPAVVLKALGKG